MKTLFIKHVVFNNKPDILFLVRVVKDAMYEKSNAKLTNKIIGVSANVERSGWGDRLEPVGELLGRHLMEGERESVPGSLSAKDSGLQGRF